MRRVALAIIFCLLSFLPVQAEPGRPAVVVSGADLGHPRPAIIFLHGMGGSGKLMQSQIDLDRVFGPLSVVSLYPSGQGRVWHLGKKTANPQDVDYLDRLIDYYISQKVMDPRRIYLAGISNGGLMVQKMICESRHRFAGAAVVVATHPDIQSCPAPKPTPLLFFWGSEDDFFPPDGIKSNSWAARKGFETRGQTLDFWRMINGCFRDALPTSSPDGKIAMRDYPECAARLTVYDMIGMGHAWPGVPASARQKNNPARNPGPNRIDEVLIRAWGLAAP